MISIPLLSDRDGHNAKHGYGRLHASRACLSAADPICAALVAIGEERAAFSFVSMRSADGPIRTAYTRTLARSLARAMVTDATLSHGVRSLVRHLRVVAAHPERQRAHGSASLVRQIAIVLRSAWESQATPPASKSVARELETILRGLEGSLGAGSAPDEAMYAALAPMWQDV